MSTSIVDAEMSIVRHIEIAREHRPGRRGDSVSEVPSFCYPRLSLTDLVSIQKCGLVTLHFLREVELCFKSANAPETRYASTHQTPRSNAPSTTEGACVFLELAADEYKLVNRCGYEIEW